MPGQKNNPAGFVSTSAANAAKNHQKFRSAGKPRTGAKGHPAGEHPNDRVEEEALSESSCSYQRRMGKPA
jgi:hypothetical protein